LLFRRLDRNGDGRLKFSDWVEAVLPRQSEYSAMINKRKTINSDGDIPLAKLLSKKTKAALINLFDLYFGTELVLEEEKVKLAEQPGFDVEQMFSMLDMNDDGFIEVADIRKSMGIHGLPVTEKELKYLMDRLDKDSDDLLSWSAPLG